RAGGGLRHRLGAEERTVLGGRVVWDAGVLRRRVAIAATRGTRYRGRMTVHGRCLCGDVAFEADAPFEFMGHCHCSMCRKHHGTAFWTAIGGPAKQFRWVRGAEKIRRYASSPGGARPFCGGCGSAVPAGTGERVFLTPGLLDDDPEMRPQAHIFVG